MGKNNREIKGNETWILLICYIALLTIIIVLATSCSPQRRLANLERNHPQLLLQFCDSKAINDTVVIPGALQIDTQTVWLRCDTVYKTDTLHWTKWEKVPVYRYLADTFVVSKIDTSGKALLRSENSGLQQQKDKLQGKLSAWQFWAIFGYIIVIILAVIVGIFLKWK